MLVATLTASTGLPWTRFFDALVGGAVGLIVMTILLPLNPLTVVRRAADPALTALADGLHQVAKGLADADQALVEDTLQTLRAAEGKFAAYAAAAAAARENVAFAPARWRARGALNQYVHGADQLTYALRNVRVLIRRVNLALADNEPVPAVLPASVGLLGDAVDLLKQELAKGAGAGRHAGTGVTGGGRVGAGVRRGGGLLGRGGGGAGPVHGDRPAAGDRRGVCGGAPAGAAGGRLNDRPSTARRTAGRTRPGASGHSPA